MNPVDLMNNELSSLLPFIASELFDDLWELDLLHTAHLLGICGGR